MNAPVRPPRDGGTIWHDASQSPNAHGADMDARIEVVLLDGSRFTDTIQKVLKRGPELPVWWRFAGPALSPASAEPEAKLNAARDNHCGVDKPSGPGWYAPRAYPLSDSDPVDFVTPDKPNETQQGTAYRAANLGAAWWRKHVFTPAATLTGSASNYYLVNVTRPARASSMAYTAECLDLIEALGMTFNEGEAFKAIWRTAAARKGNGKAGTTALCDAEKVAFYGGRMVAQVKAAS